MKEKIKSKFVCMHFVLKIKSDIIFAFMFLRNFKITWSIWSLIIFWIPDTKFLNSRLFKLNSSTVISLRLLLSALFLFCWFDNLVIKSTKFDSKFILFFLGALSFTMERKVLMFFKLSLLCDLFTSVLLELQGLTSFSEYTA